MPESETLSVSKSVPLSVLPKALKKLVLAGHVRPAKVRVTLTAEATAKVEKYWRNEVRGLGEETKHETECEWGSDGEPNYSTTMEFAGAAVSTSAKCGYMKSGASVVVAGLKESMAPLAGSSEEGFLAVLHELTSRAVWKEAEAGPVVTVTEVKPEAAPFTMVEWLELVA